MGRNHIFRGSEAKAEIDTDFFFVELNICYQEEKLQKMSATKSGEK